MTDLRQAVRVRAMVWGFTDADAEHALYKARQPDSRGRWDFAQVERCVAPTCPVDVTDDSALATEDGYHWAYAVYRAEPTDG